MMPELQKGNAMPVPSVWVRATLALVATLAIAGCSQRPLDLPAGAAAYEIFPTAQQRPPTGDYRIGPSDMINVQVFNEPDFTAPTLRVDVAGNINMPLIGRIQA